MSGKTGSSSVGSRFVSQTELDSQRQYSSTSTTSISGQEYDPRSLFERLQEHKQEKDAKYDEMFKLSNQFRGIDEAESEFLDQVAKQKKQQELEKAKREREEMEAFRAAKSQDHHNVPSKLRIGPTATEILGGKVDVGGGEGSAPSEGAKPSTTAAAGVGVGGAGTGAGGAKSKKRKANSSLLLGVVKKKPPTSTTTTPKSAPAPATAAPAPEVKTSSASSKTPPETTSLSASTKSSDAAKLSHKPST